MTLRVLITGGAGFLGSVLTEALLDRGYAVTVLDNFMYGQNSLGHLMHKPNLSVIRGDVIDVLMLNLKFFDVVLPLAAIVGAAACDASPRLAQDTNYFAVESLCRRLSVQQSIIIPTTNSGYGVGEEGKECTEESPLRPVSHYGRTKVDAEKVVMQRTNSISLRLATVFGFSPRMRMDLLVNDLVWRALREHAAVIFEADYMRNYCHIRDVAAAFLHAIDNFPVMRGQIYNVGDTRANMSKKDLCWAIKKHLPDFDFRLGGVSKDPDKRNYIVSNAKIEATGWLPAYSLDDGIRELIKGYVTLNPMRYRNA